MRWVLLILAGTAVYAVHKNRGTAASVSKAHQGVAVPGPGTTAHKPAGPQPAGCADGNKKQVC